MQPRSLISNSTCFDGLIIRWKPLAPWSKHAQTHIHSHININTDTHTHTHSHSRAHRYVWWVWAGPERPTFQPWLWCLSLDPSWKWTRFCWEIWKMGSKSRCCKISQHMCSPYGRTPRCSRMHSDSSIIPQWATEKLVFCTSLLIKLKGNKYQIVKHLINWLSAQLQY